MIDVESGTVDASYWQAAKDTAPPDVDALHDWITSVLGVTVARDAVCVGHTAPFDMLAEQFFARPPLCLWLGPRGGGKSYTAGILCHLRARFLSRHEALILGGSYQQSRQIYRAIRSLVQAKEDGNTLRDLLNNEARYWNGSEIGILAASETSVRGPHVPSLCLDEVDEIKSDMRESAMGMSVATPAASASVLMMSTRHRVAGPMAALMTKAEAGDFPCRTFCIFEVLERCPDSRSGPWVGGADGYERCPACPIQPYCHADRLSRRDLQPKAKRSRGHYAIDALIQKTFGIGRRAFLSDYMCEGPSVDGVWFREFDPTQNVTPLADYDPYLPVWVGIDSGVRCGAVFFQVHRPPGGIDHERVVVFAEYFAEGAGAFTDAIGIKSVAAERCRSRMDFLRTDPAGKSRTSIGVNVMSEYQRANLAGVEAWPLVTVVDGLALLESFLRSADGRTSLHVHPRCTMLISAFGNYKRARINDVWQDYPADPQHPHEDMIDPLRGALASAFPEGRKAGSKLKRVAASRVF